MSDLISPTCCPKCSRPFKVFTTRRTETKIVRTKQCSNPLCRYRIRTEEKVVSTNVPACPTMARKIVRTPRPAA